MLRLICIALLVCLSQGVAAQQKTAPTVLFPSGNYAPKPAAPVPFEEKSHSGQASPPHDSAGPQRRTVASRSAIRVPGNAAPIAQREQLQRLGGAARKTLR